ncbi:MAG: amidohydrolase family protein [Thermodesulfobacteriota bacterium]
MADWKKYLCFSWLCVFVWAVPGLAQDSLDAFFARTGVNRSNVKVENTEAADIPLIDAHNHLNRNIPVEALIGPMGKAGVKRMVLLPRHYKSPKDGGLASDEQARDYIRKHPGSFIPFVGGQRDDLGPKSRRWNDLAALDPLLREMREKLDTGEFFGLGEFILVHHAYEITNTTETGGEVRIRADSTAMKEFAKLAARYQVPVLFHAEAEPEVVEEVLRLFDSSPDTRFIWAHNGGRSSAEQIGKFLNRYPKLMADLGHMFNGPRTQGGYGKYWPRKTPWIHLVQDDDGKILPEMKALFEAFPDRFVIGTDTAHTPVLIHYEYRIAIFRVMLAQLTANTARKIGYENAERLFAKPGGLK